MAPPPAPPSGVNGVLPVSVLQKNAPTSAPRGPKAAQPKLKLVLRRLPPGLTRAELETALGDEWKAGGGKVAWMVWKPGKISKDLAKPSKPSRAYMQLTSQEHVAPLGDHVRQTSFNDAAKSFQDPALVGPPALEFAPFHKVPGGRRRNDARQGLIDQDPEFKDFLESLTNPVTKPAPTDVSAEGQKEDKKVTTTPLIEALREKKANKDKPQAKGGKHGRGEPHEGTDKENKKILGKGGKEATAASSEKGKRMSKAEKAAKEAVKVLNKEAAGKDTTTDKASTSSPTPAAERKRERGNASIAKSMLQRDLGIGPAANRRRGGKRELTSATPEAATKPEETAAGKDKAKDASALPPSAEKAAKPPTSPKKEAGRPTRAERRAFKAAQAEKSNKPPEDSKQQSKSSAAPPAPVILKKPQASIQAPVQTQAPPPKGPAASKSELSDPAAAKTLSANAPPTGPAAQAQPIAASTSSGRQAFLKHANASQGITEPLIEAALAVFGAIEKVEIDKRKGFAYVEFVEPEGLQKAIAASPVKVAQGAVQVLERKDKIARARHPHPPPPQHHHPHPPTGPARGRGGFSGRGRGRGGGRGGASAIQATEGSPSPLASTTPATNVPAPAPPAPAADSAT